MTPGVVFSTLVILAFLLLAVFASQVAPADPYKVTLTARLQPPTFSLSGEGAVLGTDQVGRDLLSRLLYGGRITLSVAVVAVILGGAIGTTIGILAGYFGGWTERIAMRLADVQLSLPLLLFALLVIAALGPGLLNLILVLALTGWTQFARIIRSEVLSIRSRDFILAARAAGASRVRILWRHILPNVATIVCVLATLELARVVILEAALSFIGLGVPPPNASWGRMLAEGRDYVATAWWLCTFPGLAILLLVLAINLLGDRLRDVFDPRSVNEW